MFEVRNDVTPGIMSKVFQFKILLATYVPTRIPFCHERQNPTFHGLNSIQYLVPKIWEQVPENIKPCSSLNL